MKQYKQTQPINIVFYLDNARFAGRELFTIPRQNEDVRLNNEIYRVVNVLHIYDEEYFRIAISIRRLKKGE